jgi:UDP-N-acetylglucosamine acyltransferase
MAYAHIGHDCLLDRNVVIANNAQLAGHVRVGRKAVVSGMTGVHHFASIGELTFVGGMSGVRVDLPPYMFAEGLPAEVRNINVVGLERDGIPREEISRLRDAFRQLYRDRSEPMAAVLDRLQAGLGADAASPLARLLAWQREHLELSIKGRIGEAHRRTPATGTPAAQA